MKTLLFPLVGVSLLLASCGTANNTESSTASTSTDAPAATSSMSDSSGAMAGGATADSSKMSGGAMSGGSAMANPNGPTAPHANDTEFMQSAAHSDQNEIQLSKMALAKGVSAPIKAYANQMITDHNKSTANLKPIAAKAGVTLPTDMDAEHKAMAPTMEKLTGKAFEDKFVQQMVTDHQKTANTLKAHETMTKNNDLQKWITTTLPVVEGHLSMAKQDSNMKM